MMTVKQQGKVWLLGVLGFSLLLGTITVTLTGRMSAMDPPQPLSPQAWHFDFQQAERILLGLELHPDTGLAFNRHTAEQLQRAADTLPHSLDEQSLERVAFLSRQGFPAPAAEQVAETLTDTLLYLRAKRTTEEPTHQDGSLATAESRFARAIALQDQYFGETRAQQLFLHRRQLQGYLLQRQQIQADTALDEQQRQQALADASRRFRAAREQDDTP